MRTDPTAPSPRPARHGCRALVPGLVLAALAAAGPGAAAAQAPAGPRPARAPEPFDRTVARAVADTIADQFVRVYVDADTGRMIAERLRARSRAGAYDTLTDPARLAEVLTRDLRAVNGDKHLSVQFAPPMEPMQLGPGGIPLAPMLVDEEPTGRALQEERRRHFGLGRVEILPGNVGYLKVDGFSEGTEARAMLSAALKYLETADAIVFDFRDMRGGSGNTSNFLISHFTGDDTLHSLTIRNRSSHETIERWTMAKVPGLRRPTVPLFVLTNARTVSAGEDFAFVLHNMHRATLVGETTAGAGHNNAFVDSGHGFVTSISFTRVEDPATHTEWERVGVAPDIRVPAAQALGAAHLAALDTLAARTADPRDRQQYTLVRETEAAKLAPPRVAPATLARYAGTYDDRVVTVVNGRLHYTRAGSPVDEDLVTLGENRFALGPTARISFAQERGRWMMRLTLPSGEVRSVARSGSPR